MLLKDMPHPGTWQALRDLVEIMSRFLTQAHKRQLLAVSAWACGVSALEMFVAAAVIPYVQCLRGQCLPQIISVGEYIGWPAVPLFSLGLFLLVAVKLVTQAHVNWMTVKFNQQVQRDTVNRLLDGYMHIDWMSFRSQNRAHYFRRCATTAVDAAYVSQQCVTLITSALMLVFLVVLMLTAYPLASLTLGAGFLLVNILTQRLIGRAQKAVGHQREVALQHWNIGMAEAFASFREIRVYGLERFFLDLMKRAVYDLAKANRKLNFLPALPGQILDFAIIGTLLLVVSVWLLLGRSLAELIPQLVFYAVVARAMLPAMMSLLSTRAVLAGSIVNVQLVLNELQAAADSRVEKIDVVSDAAAPAGFALENISFAHGPDLVPVLNKVTLAIAHPSWVAIVGQSGAGKSTLMELLCGIHRPDHGRVVHHWPSVDNRPEKPRVAYLPQHVALIDGSIAENVIFGFDAGDARRVDDALRCACLEAVVEKLPQGVDTRIGADGGRLSGGERQRLALARALYRSPDLLLLDEATSGLDEETETRLLSTLRATKYDMTVVFISHRLSNRHFADQVVYLEEGKLQETFPGGSS